MTPDPVTPRRQVALVCAMVGDPDADLIVRFIQEQNWEAIVVSQAAAGLGELLRRQSSAEAIGVVFIVGSVSGINGLGWLRAIRSLPGTAALPLVICDSDHDATAQHQAYTILLRRPVEVDRLADILTNPTAAAAAVVLAAPAPVVVPAVKPESSTTAGTGIVLVVDDHPANRTVICSLVRLVGQPVESCDGGQAALVRIAKGGVHLVLLDCHMPGMDGYETIAALRASEAGSERHLPVIALTADAGADNEARCRAVGMDGFLSKPVTGARLRIALQRWFPGAAQAAPPAVEPAVVVADALFDPANLRMVNGLDAGTAYTVLTMFRTDLGAALNALRQADPSTACPELVRIAHKLRGAAGSVGTPRLATVCAELEAAARAAAADRCRSAIVRVLHVGQEFLDHTADIARFGFVAPTS